MDSKLYYSIADVSALIGENPSTLRYWETEFIEIKPKRASKGRRLYTPNDIETLRMIKFLLRTKGMHITAAKEQLKKNIKNVNNRVETVKILEEVKNELEMLLSSLKKINI